MAWQFHRIESSYSKTLLKQSKESCKGKWLLNPFAFWDYFTSCLKCCLLLQKIKLFDFKKKILADMMTKQQTVWISDQASHYVRPDLDRNCLHMYF